jgi:Domain of unknown function (DUF4390)
MIWANKHKEELGLSFSPQNNCSVSRWFRVLLLLMVVLPGFSQAADFEIRSQTCRSTADAFVLDANIDFGFSDKALEALQNGVPLTLEIHLQVRRDGAWVWERDLADSRLRYQIRFHPLASVYQVIDMQNNSMQSFVTRDVAISALGDIQGMPVIMHSQMDKGKIYRVGLRTTLDIDALPLPLRPMAYLSPSWNLSSEWRSCRIRR